MLTIKIDKSIVKDLVAAASQLRDLSPPLRQLVPIVQKGVQAQFGRANNNWTPLTPRYAERKSKVAPGMPILILSGDMYRDYGREGIVTGNRYTFGNSAKQSGWHQEGTRYMPARPVDYNFVETEAVRLVEEFVDKTLSDKNL